MKAHPSLHHHEEALAVIDEWPDDGHRYRLVHRGGLYRLEVWVLYRWETDEGSLQKVSRRVAELLRGQTGANVLTIDKRAAKAR